MITRIPLISFSVGTSKVTVNPRPAFSAILTSLFVFIRAMRHAAPDAGSLLDGWRCAGGLNHLRLSRSINLTQNLLQIIAHQTTWTAASQDLSNIEFRGGQRKSEVACIQLQDVIAIVVCADHCRAALWTPVVAH